MKRVEVAKLVAMLMAGFPHKDMSELTTRVYEENLLDLDAEAAGRAVQRLIRTNTFLPTVGEIRAAATELVQGPRKAGAEAWQIVQRAIDTIGGYGVPRFADPIIQGIITRWGWPRMCWEGLTESDRARFIEMYDAAARRERLDMASGIPLPAPQGTGVRELKRGETTPAQLASGIGRDMPKAIPDREHRRLSAADIKAAMGETK